MAQERSKHLRNINTPVRQTKSRKGPKNKAEGYKGLIGKDNKTSRPKKLPKD